MSLSLVIHVTKTLIKRTKGKPNSPNVVRKTVTQIHENLTDCQEQACEEPVSSSGTLNKKEQRKLLL